MSVIQVHCAKFVCGEDFVPFPDLMTSANCELREFESFLFFLTAIATVGCLTGLVCGGNILVVAKDQAGLGRIDS